MNRGKFYFLLYISDLECFIRKQTTHSQFNIKKHIPELITHETNNSILAITDYCHFTDTSV